MYNKSILSNGVTVATERLENSKSLAMAIWLKLGSRDEALHELGICHLIEHMLFKGTTTKTARDIARELDSIGGISDAFTGKESMCFYVKVLPRHVSLAKDIIIDILKNPRFDPEDLELERQVVFQELNMVEDSPEDYIYDLLSKAMFGDHPMGRPVIGNKESLLSMGRDDLRAFWDKNVHGTNLLVSVSGSIHHQEFLKLMEKELSSFRQNGQVPKRSAPQVSSSLEILEKDLAQVHVAMGYEAPSVKDQNRMACAILNCLLGSNMSSRLFQKVREDEGLAYSIYSSYYPYSDTGIFSIYFATEKGQVNQVLEIVNREIKGLIQGGPMDWELTNAKDYSIAGIYLNTETPESRMFRNAKSEIHLGRYIALEEIEKMVEGVTARDVQGAAEAVFGKNAPSVAVVGPIGKGEIEL